MAYLYAVARHDPGFRDHILANVSGTTGSRQRVRPADVLSATIVQPTNAALEAFAAIADPLYHMGHAFEAESQTLSALRDTLLPKLISGEMRLREVEESVA